MMIIRNMTAAVADAMAAVSLYVQRGNDEEPPIGGCRFEARMLRESLTPLRNMLYEVLWCDQIASEGKARLEETDKLRKHIERVLDQPMSLKDLAVNGEDLMEIGIPKGPELGKILSQLLDMVIDYPTLNDRETLLRQAESLFNTK